MPMRQRTIMMRAPNDVEQFLAKAARRFVRRAVSVDPDHPGAQLRWAVELVDQPRQARYHLRRAAELGRGDPALEYQVACVLLELGDIRAALQLARRARGHVEDAEFPFVGCLVNLTGRL